MDFKVHYPQNTISHCIISNETQITLHFFQGRISAMPDIRVDSNETQITLHFFQGRISAMPDIRVDLFLAISKTGMRLLTS